MVHDIPGCYGSRTTPTIQEEAALREGEVTRVTGSEGSTEPHRGEAILKSCICIYNVLTLIDGGWSISINKSAFVGVFLGIEMFNSSSFKHKHCTTDLS